MGMMDSSSSWAVRTKQLFLLVCALATFASTQATAGYEEVGCYKDRKKGLIMVRGFTSKSMTVEKCNAHCRGSIYFGVKNGTKCFCDAAEGDIDYPFDKYGESTACDMPCSGNQEENCGGAWAVKVFQKAYDDVGCYNDPYSTRIMKWGFESPSMTVEACGEYCDGSIYYGLKSDDRCFCDRGEGDEDYPYDVHGESTGCTLPCAGDKTQKCGGPWAVRVFKKPYY